ncbi:glycosyltransferase family 4 protein [Micromonospora sp. CPCC 206061]|uniref:glycosyltransferase family 4 protein n=1 Tax=Micromonospora sp. CPCC 206061 TaxID=3122410 RepID=UPI002FEF5EF3
MHLLITAVGKRTEHWTALFAALCKRPDVAVTVLAADVSEVTRRELQRQARQCPRLRYHVLPHLLGEDLTGHMASVLFRPGAGRLLTGQRPDVIHIIGEAAYLSTWQVLRQRRRLWPRVPVTLYAAQNIVIRFPVPFPLLERRAYRAVDHAFPITPAALDVLRTKGYQGPADIVPLGVDTDVFKPRQAPARPPQRFTAGFVGRLEPYKGVRDLLHAVELADCDLLLVGDGSLTPEVRQAATRRPGRIRLHGWADHAELSGLLAQMDVLVLPSIEVLQRNVVPWIGVPLREQFGRVLIEAMASGLPVVGSDVGEIPHVMGDAGLSFPAGDAARLAARLAQLRDSPDLARRLSERGIARAATQFAWDRVADSLCRVWEQLIAGKSADGTHSSNSGTTAARPTSDLSDQTNQEAMIS